MRTSAWVLAITLLIAACGNESGATSVPPTSATASTTTLLVTTSSHMTVPLLPAATSTTPEVTTTSTPAADLTVEKVLAWMKAQYPHFFSPLGGFCGDTGSVDAGGVFACGGSSATGDTSVIDYDGGTVVYVLDESGRAAWTSGSDVPGPTEVLLELYDKAPKGLFCRDLLSADTDAFPFDGSGRPAQSAFFWSLVYWSLEGEPTRMDADGNGTPCETLYEPEVVEEVLAGGPVP